MIEVRSWTGPPSGGCLPALEGEALKRRETASRFHRVPQRPHCGEVLALPGGFHRCLGRDACRRRSRWGRRLGGELGSTSVTRGDPQGLEGRELVFVFLDVRD